MTTSGHGFDLDFQRFERKMAEDTKELTEKVQKSRELEAEINTLQAKIAADKHEIEKMKPEIRHLEQEKSEQHHKLQDLEAKNREEINEHLHDRSKLIRPSHN